MAGPGPVRHSHPPSQYHRREEVLKPPPDSLRIACHYVPLYYDWKRGLFALDPGGNHSSYYERFVTGGKGDIAIYPGVLDNLRATKGTLLFTPGFWIIWESIDLISF
jgi:hypothetical protein